jgi:DNA-binding FrmR family transcriptional regulator
MVEQGATCLDVLTQISAARAALDQFGVVVLSEHLEGCIVEASIDRSPSMESRLEEMRKSLDQFLPLFSTALPGRWREPTETATDLAEISPTQ